MRKSQFKDRCFVAVVFIALMGLFTAVAFALTDHEPRSGTTTLVLPQGR